MPERAQGEGKGEEPGYKVKEISEKMKLIFMYHCPMQTSASGKAAYLAKKLIDRARLLLPHEMKKDKKGEYKEIISSKTLYEWSEEKERYCDEKKVKTFTKLLELEEAMFRDQPTVLFLRHLISKVATLSDIFKKFEKAKMEDWRKLRGFYSIYYSTPDNTIVKSLLYIGDPIKYRASIKLCCVFDDTQRDYEGHWSFEGSTFYAFFEGPTQDGVSVIMANLPSAKKMAPFEGIILSKDMRDSLKSPFSSRILIVPELTGNALDEYILGSKESIDDIWKSIQEYIAIFSYPHDLEKRIGEQAYNIISEGFTIALVAHRQNTDKLGKAELPTSMIKTILVPSKE